MKVSSKEEVGFKPIVLEIVIESEEEARAMYAIFNYSPNAELFDPATSYKIVDCIGQKYGQVYGEKIIARDVTYNQFYRRKKDS